MLEIGALKNVPVTTGFGRTMVRVKDSDGNPVTKNIPAEVWRITRSKLDGHFCRDRGRRLIVGLLNGDILSIRPEGRLRRTAEVTITLADVYSFCLRSKALGKQLENARAIKLKKQAIRARRRIAAADKRLTRPL